MLGPEEKDDIKARLLDGQKIRKISDDTDRSMGVISNVKKELEKEIVHENYRARVKIAEFIRAQKMENEQEIANNLSEFNSFLKLKLGSHGPLLQNTVKEFEQRGILDKFGVTLVEFHNASTVLKADGISDPSQLPQALQERTQNLVQINNEVKRKRQPQTSWIKNWKNLEAKSPPTRMQ